MSPSAAAAGATAVQNELQGPPSPGQPSLTPRANRGLNGHQKGPAVKRPGPRPNSPMSELGNLLEEPAGGPNSGRRASTNPEVEGRHLPLGAEEWQAAEFMREGGWSVARVKDPTAAGMSGHRGTLHPDEHVDTEALRPMVERELGFTYEQVRSVYRQGRLSAEQGELRARIDARLLALSRSGTNLSLLGRLLGFKTTGDTLHRFLKNALARARDEEVTS